MIVILIPQAREKNLLQFLWKRWNNNQRRLKAWPHASHVVAALRLP
jgi:hypothetical protein